MASDSNNQFQEVKRWRFAPSPTGYLHVGNGRIALLNYLWARNSKGKFILRFDDTDVARGQENYRQAIIEDLDWLGLQYDDQVAQSQRLEIYEKVFRQLLNQGHIYDCYESPSALTALRQNRSQAGQPPVYRFDKDRLRATTKPYWRLKLAMVKSAWSDKVFGPVSYHLSHLSDPVIRRSDGSFLYHLPSVIDDIDLDISHIVRGEDHLTNTAMHLEIYRLLDKSPPVFAHVPLLTQADGARLSKRDKTRLSLRDLRLDGLEAAAVKAVLSVTGTGRDPHSAVRDQALIDHFSIESFSRSPQKIDPNLLHLVNTRLWRSMSLAEVRDRLGEAGNKLDQGCWQIICDNVDGRADVLAWIAICYSELESNKASDQNRDFLSSALTLLPPEPWSEETWSSWTKAVGQKFKRRGRDLFHPLRLALTGRSSGPSMQSLLLVIGRDRCIQRLSGKQQHGATILG